MVRKANDGSEGMFGERLPGTGGDVIRRDADVEGHRIGPWMATDDESGPEGLRIPDAGGPTDGDPDVEGHLYRGGPTTQGEFAKRGPGDNPHGER